MEKFCVNCIYEREPAAFEPCLSCFPNDKQNFIPKPTTNADKYFRYATDEELVAWLCDHVDCRYCPAEKTGCLDDDACIDVWLTWLKQEAESAEECEKQ